MWDWMPLAKMLAVQTVPRAHVDLRVHQKQHCGFAAPMLSVCVHVGLVCILKVGLMEAETLLPA